MERQDYNDYLKEIERIKTMPKAAFMRDEIISFTQACALPDIVSLLLLSEAAKEGKTGISNKYSASEIESIDDINFRDDDYRMFQFINELINYEIDLYYKKEKRQKRRQPSNSELRRTKCFIDKDINRKDLEIVLIQLTDKFSLFETIKMASRFAELVTDKELYKKKNHDKINLKCNTNLFVFILTEIEDHFNVWFKRVAFTHFPILFSEDGNQIKEGGIKSAITTFQNNGGPARKEEVQEFFRTLKKH